MESNYQINVKKDNINGKGEGLKVRSTEKWVYQSCLTNCDLGDPPTPVRSVRQHFFLPDILTPGGCKRK